MDIMNILNQSHDPKIHIFEAEESIVNDIYINLKNNLPSSTYLVSIDGMKISNLDELFKVFAEAFHFPDYFGSNWAAFDECLNDLGWIDASSYILLIKNADKIMIDERDFKTLIKNLNIATNEWANGRNFDNFPTLPTPFNIIFGVSINKGIEFQNRIHLIGINEINLFKV